MSHGLDFVVPPRSWDDIHCVAERVRTMMGLDKFRYVPVVDLLERIMDHKLQFVRVEFGTYEEMDGAEGLTDPAGEFIQIREDVYLQAVQGDGRARFTIAHELGHYFLHTKIPMARKPAGMNVASYRLGEPQANQFAAELLMPRKFIHRGATKAGIIEDHGVSDAAAAARIDFLTRRNLLN